MSAGSIPELIEASVDRCPLRPAVSFRDTTLTYRDFDELANGLAHDLTARGVRPGDFVAVLMPNSLELPIAYYAIMKLGAVFVPLDPAWPADRIDTTVRVLNEPLVLRTIELRRSTVRPQHRVQPGDLIYGIFTSGTTGTPKCALNLHAGLTNRFLFMSRYFAATGDEVVLQNSRHTYDSSVWQLFWPLITGGRTVIPLPSDFLDLEQTVSLIERHRVTLTDFVPSVFNALVSIVDTDRGQLARLASLRELVVGGEEINPRMAHRLAELLPDVRITNGYGPTEASIGMIFHPVSAQDGDTIPLGRPIDNCFAEVVDDELALVPAGEPGELVIGGVCLGAGYLGDPERTEQAFVPNPFAHIPGDRLYRTGDVARVDEQGRLHFLGRRDSQVKVGGVRLELGEIEAAANRCPGVRHSKVLPVDRGAGLALALFVCGDEDLHRTGVREHLATLLPRHHLPRHVIVLDAMPLNGNGKVDRIALVARLEERMAAAGGESLGRTATRAADRESPLAGCDEHADPVLAVFRRVLGLHDLQATDDFRKVGGDSIQAVAAVAELTRVSGVRIGVQDLFDCPDATAMTALIERRRLSDEDTDTEDTEELWRHDLSHAQAAAPAKDRTPQRILVTGPTGFVGSRLVHELLSATDLEVDCLARGADDADAQARVVAALVEQGLWEESFHDRLTVFAGDLSAPSLGLTEPVWNHLAQRCDVVLHNGALVNFLFDYRAHRGANVLGAMEVVRLADGKPLHYVSTLGTLDGEAARRAEPMAEAVDITSIQPPGSGYSRSKWVAEQLLRHATVYRLGEIMPSADNGRPNPRALTHLLLSAFLKLNASPEVAMRSDYTPVDYTARRIVAGIQDSHVRGRALHVFHPESVCYADALARVGHPIDRVSCRVFVKRLTEAAHDTGDRDLQTLLGLLHQPADSDEAALRRLFAALLTDNPRLFGKDECRRLEKRWGLSDEWLYRPIAAYRDHLSHF